MFTEENMHFDAIQFLTHIRRCALRHTSARSAQYLPMLMNIGHGLLVCFATLLSRSLHGYSSLCKLQHFCVCLPNACSLFNTFRMSLHSARWKFPHFWCAPAQCPLEITIVPVLLLTVPVQCPLEITIVPVPFLYLRNERR